MSHLRDQLIQAFPESPLDWSRGEREGTCSVYASQVDEAVRPLMNKEYSDFESLESDIALVTDQLLTITCQCIPRRKKAYHSRKQVHDHVLTDLCWKSRSAFRQWKNSGRPLSGPIYNQRIKSKRAVKFHLNACKAREERRRIQQHDDLFKNSHPRRFQIRGRKGWMFKVMCGRQINIRQR